MIATIQPAWLEALTLVLNVVQALGIAYVTNRWRKSNGAVRELQAAADRTARAAELVAERPPAGGPG